MASLTHEDVPWMLVRAATLAFLLWTVRRIWVWLPWALILAPLKPSTLEPQTESKETIANGREHAGGEVGSANSAWFNMGQITPSSDLDYRTIKPERIYRFNPKYFLTMGLQKTDVNFITHMDDTYADRMKARQDIARQYPSALDSLDSGVGMVNELYVFLVQAYLPKRYPAMFQIDASGATLHNIVTGEHLPFAAPEDRYEALAIINRNVDEDFLMLLPSPDGDGYSLQAFVWAYPVGFDPQSKLGMKLRDAHKPVPGYKEKLAASMDRYFGRLQPGTVMYRVNWAVATSDALCERGEYHLYPGQEPTETEFDLDRCYVRCELQTLFALPKSGGRILSVHLYLYPLQEIKDVGLGPNMVEAIDGLKEGNVPGFHRYKRAIVWGERVKDFLMG